MRAAAPLPVVLLALVVACNRAREEDSSVRAADSARLATARAATPAASPARADAPGTRADSGSTAAAGSPDAGRSLASAAASDTLCAGVAAAAQRALKIEFTRDSGSAFPSPSGRGPLWIGCRVKGTGTVRRFSAVAAMPEQKLRAAMRGTGWVEDLNFEASGPEGSAFALRRGHALCHYDILFPESSGDDDGEIDSAAPPDTSVPPLRYVVRILCTPSAPPRGA